jgi:hypothetical protein
MFWREVGVDARVVEARALGGGHRLEVAQVVLHEQRHVVATTQADRAVDVGESVGVGLELGERQLLTGCRHDEGRTVGVLLGVGGCVHAART